MLKSDEIGLTIHACLKSPTGTITSREFALELHNLKRIKGKYKKRYTIEELKQALIGDFTLHIPYRWTDKGISFAQVDHLHFIEHRII